MKKLVMLIAILATEGISFADGQIDIATVPYVISQPGSYILVKDLTATSNQTALSISTSNVTLDLNGHTLYGAGSTTGTTGYGILASSLTENINIYNGVIRDFRLDGIHLEGINNQVHLNRVYANGSTGIYVSGSGMVWNNVIRLNIVDGIFGAGN